MKEYDGVSPWIVLYIYYFSMAGRGGGGGGTALHYILADADIGYPLDSKSQFEYVCKIWEVFWKKNKHARKK